MSNYAAIANTGGALLLIVLLGFLLARVKIFPPAFVEALTKTVFYVGFPATVIQSIAQTNFYDTSLLWNYIVAFLVYRIFVAVGIFLFMGIFQRNDKAKLATFVQHWLALAWLSTIILGVPFLQAIFPKRLQALAQRYGVLAGLSSFFFQLPLMLLCLETHRALSSSADGEYQQAPGNSVGDGNAKQPVDSPTAAQPRGSLEVAIDQQPAQQQAATADSNNSNNGNSGCGGVMSWQHLRRVGVVIGLKIGQNPVIWAVVIGFILSLTKLTPTYMSSTDPYRGMQWLNSMLTYLAGIVTPVSMLAIGVFLDSHLAVFADLWLMVSTAAYMILKLLIAPLLMIAIAKFMDLHNEVGRAAVVIASQPVALAAFSLAKTYSHGEKAMTTNIIVGTLLVLPSMLYCNAICDSLDLFPVPLK